MFNHGKILAKYHPEAAKKDSAGIGSRELKQAEKSTDSTSRIANASASEDAAKSTRKRPGLRIAGLFKLKKKTRARKQDRRETEVAANEPRPKTKGLFAFAKRGIRRNEAGEDPFLNELPGSGEQEKTARVDTAESANSIAQEGSPNDIPSAPKNQQRQRKNSATADGQEDAFVEGFDSQMTRLRASMEANDGRPSLPNFGDLSVSEDETLMPDEIPLIPDLTEQELLVEQRRLTTTEASGTVQFRHPSEFVADSYGEDAAAEQAPPDDVQPQAAMIAAASESAADEDVSHYADAAPVEFLPAPPRNEETTRMNSAERHEHLFKELKQRELSDSPGQLSGRSMGSNSSSAVDHEMIVNSISISTRFADRPVRPADLLDAETASSWIEDSAQPRRRRF